MHATACYPSLSRKKAQEQYTHAGLLTQNVTAIHLPPPCVPAPTLRTFPKLPSLLIPGMPAVPRLLPYFSCNGVVRPLLTAATQGAVAPLLQAAASAAPTRQPLHAGLQCLATNQAVQRVTGRCRLSATVRGGVHILEAEKTQRGSAQDAQMPQGPAQKGRGRSTRGSEARELQDKWGDWSGAGTERGTSWLAWDGARCCCCCCGGCWPPNSAGLQAFARHSC